MSCDVLSVISCAAARLFSLGGPYDWPITRSTPYFDFYYIRPLMQYLHTEHFFRDAWQPFLYPAAAVPLYVAFSFHHAFTVFLLLCAFLWSFLTVLFWRALRARGIGGWTASGICLVAVAGSYPLAFAVQRGNFEILIAAVTALGTAAFLKGRGSIAAVLWGIFGAIKIYPLLLLAMFIPSRRFKQIGLGIGAAAVATLLALWYTGPSVPAAYKLSHYAVQHFMQIYPYGPNREGYEHSFFGLVKLVLMPLHPSAEHLWKVLSPLLALGMLILYFWKIVGSPVANQLLFLTVGMVAIPPYSWDYTLLHLYAPWAVMVLVAVEARGNRVPGLASAMVALAILMSPQNYMEIHIFFQGAFKAAVLVALLVICTVRPFRPIARIEGVETSPDGQAGRDPVSICRH